MNEITLTPTASHVPATVQPAELTVAELKRRKNLIDDLVRDLMIEGQHYGVIPGTDGKQTLLKSGAEMLCSTFRLKPTFNIAQKDLGQNHREYRATCVLTCGSEIVATGEGLATTMESKHRWRLAGRKCPTCGREAIRKGKNGFFCGEKVGGCGANFPANDKRIAAQPIGRQENPDVADQWNTVLKMACKRSLVAATLLATGASDMFAHDDEDDDRDDPHPADRDDAPPAEQQLTSKQAAIRDVAQRIDALKAAGRTREGISDLMLEHGITPPTRFGDLDEPTLVRLRAVLQAELEAGQETKK